MELWTPEQTDVDFWVDFSSSEYLQVSSGMISGATDRSGNGAVIDSVTGAEPSLVAGPNQRTIADFNGSARLTHGYSASNTRLTIFAVAGVEVSAGYRGIFSTNGDNSFGQIMMLARGSGDQWGTFDGAYRSAGTNLQGIGLSLLSMVRATSGGAYLLNGAIDGNFPNTRGQVGNIGGIAGQELVGKIGEIIVIEGSVPAYLSAAIEGYLSHKWGIEGFLPTLHPYKNTPPRFDTGGAIQASKVSGIVQIDGTPAERTVRAFGYSPTVQDIDGESLNLSKSLGHATSDPETGEYTIDLLDGYDQRIFVVAFDDYGADFKPDLAVAVGDRVHPTTPNGHVWECTGSGTLPSEEPAWVIDTETDQLYGTASMIARPFYRPMVHGPVTPEVVQQDPAP